MSKLGYRLVVWKSHPNRQILKRLGYPDTDIAYDGVEAVELTSKNVYDLVLMDVNMPRQDGLQSTMQ